MDGDRVPLVTSKYYHPPVTGRKRRTGRPSRSPGAHRQGRDPSAYELAPPQRYANLPHPITPYERVLNRFQGVPSQPLRSAPFVPRRIRPGEAARGTVFADLAPLPPAYLLAPLALNEGLTLDLLLLAGHPGEAESATAAGRSRDEILLACLLLPGHPTDAYI